MKRNKHFAEVGGMLRVGVFQRSRCNSWPLVHFLEQELSGAIISEWEPTDICLRLMTHNLDLALLPIADLMNLSRGKIVSDCCIACCGVVQSVKLISKKPISRIGTLALDVSSRSSVLMCELLLRHYFGILPKKYRLDVTRPLDGCGADAFVVVGDKALGYQPDSQWEYRYDLGEIWYNKTGLPFVFAAWASCTENIWANRNCILACKKTRDRGIIEIDTLLDQKYIDGTKHQLERNTVKSYLTNSIIYKLGKNERAGLQLFFDLALQYGYAKYRTVVDVSDFDT
ncbi:MAG: menaquinone biosynthesis protein [Planctomycetaceae bacterium]|jgi:chorismate dehydratase|nr:menaquinone biosynthesis protein [Planctomycetaceae bacterium]